MAEQDIEATARKIAFSQARGLKGASGIEMLKRVGDLRHFFEFSRSQLQALTSVDADIFDPAYRQRLLDEGRQEAAWAAANNISCLLYGEDGYPQRLLNCEDAPLMLYVLGKRDLDFAHSVAVVGTRHATTYGIEFTKKLVADLAQKLPSTAIISGLAYGIDIAAHRAAMEAGLPTVAVFGHGLSMVYPAEHRYEAGRIVQSGGALCTEYAHTNNINRGNFLARNRIVAGLSDCTVVVESDLRGGSMSTAHIALNYNREVMAAPGRTIDIYSRGTNKLIASNVAAMITEADDLIKLMGWTPQQVCEPDPPLFRPLEPEQARLLQYLRQHPEATENEICIALAMKYSRLSDIIFQLELDDVLTRLPGGRLSVIAPA